MTDTEKHKRYRNRANRNWRALRKEYEKFGYYDDSGGKRYLAGIYYVLAREMDKAASYFDWYADAFADDAGEPVFLLCWALSTHHSASEEEARRRFHNAMLSNLYLMPSLLGEPIEPLDIWHSTNRERTEYLSEVDEWLRDFPSADLSWLRSEYEMAGAEALRGEYVRTYHKLKHEEQREARREILQKWYAYAEDNLGKTGLD